MDAKAARFVIVSGDTQRLAPSSTPMASAGYLEMKAVLNHLYARSHGYDFWFYQYDTADNSPQKTCSVDGTTGSKQRHASWCKLLVVADVFATAPAGQGVRGVLWMDTDAHFATPGVSLHKFLATVREGSGCKTLFRGAPELFGSRKAVDEADLLTAQEYPGCGGPFLAAILLFRNTHGARAILRDWWNMEVCASSFPWEQRALSSYYMNIKPNGTAVLDVGTMQSKFRPATPSLHDANPHEFFGHDGHVVEAHLAREIAGWCANISAFANSIGQAPRAAGHRLPGCDEAGVPAVRRLRGVRALATLHYWGVTDGQFQRALHEVRTSRLRTVTRARFDALAKSVHEDRLVRQAHRLVRHWRNVSSGPPQYVPRDCRWISVGYCDERETNRQERPCPSREESAGVTFSDGPNHGGWYFATSPATTSPAPRQTAAGGARDRGARTSHSPTRPPEATPTQTPARPRAHTRTPPTVPPAEQQAAAPHATGLLDRARTWAGL